MSLQGDLSAVEIELGTYKIVLFGVVLPVLSLGALTFLVYQAVVDTYRLACRLAALWGEELKPVAQVNFEGRTFLAVAATAMLLTLVAFSVQFLRASKRGRPQRTLPDTSGGRRFREVPARLQTPVGEAIRRLWVKVSVDREPPPRALCFASTGMSACVTEIDGGPAIALSTGLIDHMSNGEERLASVIILHEMAHLVGGDLAQFRTLAAFVVAYRRTYMTLLGAITAVYVVSMFVEYFDLAGIDPRSPSLAAYLVAIARDVAFCYASMVLALRYVALIIMLTELRADLRAALALGGFDLFASAVRGAKGVKASPRLHLVQSWVGTKVAHLTADERLSLLERPRRLLTPKYRYFAASLFLSVFLIINGSLAFSGFDWILQAGVIATIAAVNAITVAMFLGVDMAVLGGVGFHRNLATAVIVVVTNGLLLFSPSEVMGTTGSIVVAISDPNFNYSQGEFGRLLSEWYVAAAKPALDAIGDGRMLLWTLAVFMALRLSAKVSGGARTVLLRSSAAVAAVLATIVVAAGAPFATYLLLPHGLWESRKALADFVNHCGPVIPVVAGAAIGMVAGIFGGRAVDAR